MLLLLLISTTTTPVFAEVSSLKTNSDSFYKGDKIKFSGTVEKGSIGLVTIVIRDINDDFVLLTQAGINHNNTFEKIVNVENRFTEHGIYNATGFILNMTKGVTADFGVSLNGSPIILNGESIKQEIFQTNPTMNENIKKIDVQETNPITKVVDFVDSSKDPQHYVERYYNEPSYKSWFDRNYPELTIEEAVNYEGNVNVQSTVQELIDKEILPKAQASSIVEPTQELTDNSEIAQISLAVAGLGILLGAVYGIKIKVDNNSKQISINKDTIRRKLVHSIIGSNPKEIIQIRLAKGEITLEEYEKLKSKLN